MDKREKLTNDFIKRIEKETTYVTFDDKYELVYEIKRSLIKFIDDKISSKRFDAKIVQRSSLKDVDDEVYENYFNKLNNAALLSLKEYKNTEELLSLIHAGEVISNNFHLTNAGLLFFSNNIKKYKIEHEIKMVRFQGKDRLTILDYHESHAPIPVLLDEVEHFFKRNTRHGAIVKDFGRVSIPEYPFDAIHEAVVNAIAHRDYTIYGDTITFYIYSNRIEIISPGISLISVENLGKENPIHRNEVLCNIFRYTKYMEHVGTGIKRMKNAMYKEGLSELIFENVGNEFKVTFYGRNNANQLPLELTENEDTINLKDLGLNNRQITTLKHIINNEEIITTKKYMEMFNVSKSTAARDLTELVKHNLISRSFNEKPIKYFKIRD